MLDLPLWLKAFLEFEAMVLLMFVALAIPVALWTLLLDAWERHKRNRR